MPEKIPFEATRSYVYRAARYELLPRIVEIAKSFGLEPFLLRDIWRPMLAETYTPEQLDIRVRKARSDATERMSTIFGFMKEQDWNFPEGRFLAYVLGPIEHGQAPIFIVLNAAPEAIAFKLPKMPEYRNWQQVVNTADSKQTAAEFASGSEAKAPPRSVLAFAGSA